jgi:membrane protein
MANQPYRILRTTIRNWNDDGASNWAAALAFYTMLSIGPLLFVAVAIAGLAFGKDAATRAMMAQSSGLMGEEAAQALSKMMQQASTPSRGLMATAAGLATLLFGATGVFAALQDAMDSLWHVRPKADAGIKLWLKKRFLSASMVLGLGFLLMVSLVLNGAISALWGAIGAADSRMLQAAEFATSWGLGTALLAAMFRVLPDAQLKMRAAWVGAVFTAFLLNIGKVLIGLYLGHSGVTSSFGAAGSLALVLIWVYYAAQVLFVGAAFTRVYSQERGEAIAPDRDAEAIETVPVGTNGGTRAGGRTRQPERDRSSGRQLH